MTIDNEEWAMKHFQTLVVALILQGICFSVAYAQETVQDTVTKTMVQLVRADSLNVNKNINEQLKVITGNVVFRHDSSYMYCDSAHLYEIDNNFEAFRNVRIEQGDTLFVYGDYLFYESKQELARMRHNVRMVNIQQDSSIVTLYTDSLDYDRRADVGYYFEWGRIVDVENELTSIYGQYSPQTKIAEFQDSVCLTNPNFILYSDTLEYSTETKIANILGPTIIESDSGVIHSTKGWYNTQDNTSLLLDRSKVFSGEKIMTGDSLAYDRNLGIGEAFGDISIVDTAQMIILTGHYGYYEEKTEYAFVTDSACAIEYSQGDSLFLYGDTLELTSIDSTARILRAFMGVRFYRFDIQGICDSMRFNTKDSVLYMYGKPVLWNENQQLFGDTIIIYMADTAVDHVHVPTSAFVAQEVEPGYFNQLGGNDLKAYFAGQYIRQIDIDGNAESIFYPLDGKDNTMIGRNYTQSSYLSMWFEEGKFDRWKIWSISNNKMIPVPDLTLEQKTLKKFAWYDEIRPADRYDIFRFYNSKNKRENDTPMENGEVRMENEETEN